MDAIIDHMGSFTDAELLRWCAPHINPVVQELSRRLHEANNQAMKMSAHIESLTNDIGVQSDKITALTETLLDVNDGLETLSTNNAEAIGFLRKQLEEHIDEQTNRSD